MTDARAPHHVLFLTAATMALFGAVVLAACVVARWRGRSPRSLVAKYLAWFVIIPPVVLPLAYSRPAFQAVVLLLSLQCLREFGRVTGLWADRGVMRLCYLLTAGMYVPIFAGWPGLHQAGPLVALGVLLIVPIVRGRYEQMLQKVSLSVLGVLYFGWFLSHLACVRSLEGGIAAAFFLMVLAACNDALGYLWGTWLGRRPLSPRISPHKTVEGAVLAAASVIAVGYLLRGLLPEADGAQAMLLAAMVAVLAVLGDLVISFIKRDVGVKDMGRAIPGHGGVLDRCDSLILAAPVFFHAVGGL